LTRLLCVDLGSTYRKLAFVNGPGDSLSQPSIEPSARFFESNGHATLSADLRTLARADVSSALAGLALALPFEVDYQRNRIASNWLGGWPDSVRGLEASLADDLGLPCVVLNDAVAFALGCPAMRFESGPQTVLCLILGTYFGCALLKSSATVQPVEVDDCLPNFAWPSGVSGSPTAALHFHRQHDLNDGQAYSRLVGWLVGALQQELGRLPVVLGGGRASSVQVRAVLSGVQEAGGVTVDVRVETDQLIGVAGAGRLWREVIERRRPIQEVVAARR
jgi:hypothetical protein